MSSAFAKDTLRTIRGSLKRFLSLAAICVLGITMLVGITIACEDLRASADEFFDAQRLYDVSVQSTLGLTDDDVAALSALDGVEAAAGSWDETAYTSVGGARQAVRVQALVDGMNEPRLLEGRLPTQADEVAVTQEYLEESGAHLGDVVTFGVEGEAEEGSDTEAGEAGSDEKQGSDAPATAGPASQVAPLTALRGQDTPAGRAEEDAGSEEGSVDTSLLDEADDEADAGASKELFATHPYTIVASVIDPTNVAAKNGTSSFRATGTRHTFFVTADAATSDAYSVVYLRVAGAATKDGFSEGYDALVSHVKAEAEAIKDEREAARTQQVRDEADAKVSEAETDANEQFEDAETQLGDAQSKLDEARAQIAEGREQLESQKDSALGQLDDAQERIDAGRERLEDAKAELDRNEAKLDAAASRLPGGTSELAAAKDRLAGKRADYEKGALEWQATREGLAAKLADAQGQVAKLDESLGALRAKQAETQARIDELEAAGDPAQQGLLEQLRGKLAETEQALSEAEAGRAEAQAGADKLSSAIDDGDRQVAEGKAAIDDAQAGLDQWQAGLEQVSSGRAQLAAGRSQLEASAKELERGQEELDRQRAEADKQLREGAIELNDAEREADDGQEELDESRATYEREKADALAKISDARAKVDDLAGATWYVQDRSAISSYASIDSDASSIEVIGTVFPVIFLTVAVLVSLTTATRMVEEERSLIGLYKALGYSRARIMSKYLAYALAASALGGVVGSVLGFVALPEFLFTVFSTMYVLPAFSLHFDAGLCALAVGMFVVGICLATALTVRGELSEQPAALMRPRAPKAGTRILLERVEPVWRRLSFLDKVTARNIFRYKRRLAMTVFGVAGCCALMICGFAISDTVLALSPNQYGGQGRQGVYEYDLMAVTQPDDLEGAAARLTGSGDVEGYVAVRTENVTIEHDGAKETVQLVVVPDGFSLDGYIDLRDEGGRHLELAQATAGADGVAGSDDDGALLTKNASTVLGFGTGDTVDVQDSALRKATVAVDGIVTNYLGNAVYLTQATYERLLSTTLEPNALLAHLSGDADAQIAFADELAGDPTFLSVTSVQKGIRDFSANFMLINYVVVLITALAAGLSFVVLYTLSATNISERERELATIKVLGFRKREVHRYINKETVILTLIGILAGCPLGYAITRFLTYVLRMPSLFFDTIVEWPTYVFAGVMSLVFTLLINKMTDRSLDKIDMVGALKSAE